MPTIEGAGSSALSSRRSIIRTNEARALLSALSDVWPVA